MIIPHNDSMINGYDMVLEIGSMNCAIRIIPYPPSFSRIAASTIDPAIGASTWAFGNHKCSPYRGNLTMKAVIHASHNILLCHVFGSGDDS